MFKLSQKDDKFILQLDDKTFTFYNCKNVSTAFIRFMCEDAMEMVSEDFSDGFDEDLAKIRDEGIRYGWWNWKEECKEFRGHDDIDIEMINNVYGDRWEKRKEKEEFLMNYMGLLDQVKAGLK